MQYSAGSYAAHQLFGSEQDEELAPPQQEGNNRRGAAPARGVGVQGGGADPGGLKRARDSAHTVPYIYINLSPRIP